MLPTLKTRAGTYFFTYSCETAVGAPNSSSAWRVTTPRGRAGGRRSRIQIPGCRSSDGRLFAAVGAAELPAPCGGSARRRYRSRNPPLLNGHSSGVRQSPDFTGLFSILDQPPKRFLPNMDQNVHMVWHDTPRQQLTVLVVEIQQRFLGGLSDPRVAKKTRTQPAVEVSLQLRPARPHPGWRW